MSILNLLAKIAFGIILIPVLLYIHMYMSIGIPEQYVSIFNAAGIVVFTLGWIKIFEKILENDPVLKWVKPVTHSWQTKVTFGVFAALVGCQTYAELYNKEIYSLFRALGGLALLAFAAYLIHDFYRHYKAVGGPEERQSETPPQGKPSANPEPDKPPPPAPRQITFINNLEKEWRKARGEK